MLRTNMRGKLSDAWRACTFNNVSEPASKNQPGMAALSCSRLLPACHSCTPSIVTTANLPLLHEADVWLSFIQCPKRLYLFYSDYFNFFPCLSHLFVLNLTFGLFKDHSDMDSETYLYQYTGLLRELILEQ